MYEIGDFCGERGGVRRVWCSVLQSSEKRGKSVSKVVVWNRLCGSMNFRVATKETWMVICTLGVESFYIGSMEQDAYLSVKQYVQDASII